MGMGQAATALPDYDWSVFVNPALLNSHKTAIGFYGIRNYGFVELTDIAAFSSIPTKFGVAAVGFHRYGDNLFTKTTIRAGYKNSWNNLHFGVSANYNQINFGGDYGKGGAIALDAGLAAEIVKGLWLGARSMNISMSKYDGIDEDLPKEIAIGFSYQLNELAVFAFDVVKDVAFDAAFRGGIEVNIIENLKGRVGVTDKPSTYSAGFGYSKDKWEVNILVQKHTHLDFSPGMDMMIYF